MPLLQCWKNAKIASKNLHAKAIAPCNGPVAKLSTYRNYDRSLVLERCHIRPRNLGKWMARMPQVQYLSIYGGNICEDFHSDFRSVLDVVRNQSKGMRVRLSMLWTKTTIDFDHHTHDFAKILEEKEQQSDWDNVNRNLRLYLSGKVDWNPDWLDVE